MGNAPLESGNGAGAGGIGYGGPDRHRTGAGRLGMRSVGCPPWKSDRLRSLVYRRAVDRRTTGTTGTDRARDQPETTSSISIMPDHRRRSFSGRLSGRLVERRQRDRERLVSGDGCRFGRRTGQHVGFQRKYRLVATTIGRGLQRRPGNDRRFSDMLQAALESCNGEVELGTVHLVSESKYAIARGCLIRAELEEGILPHAGPQDTRRESRVNGTRRRSRLNEYAQGHVCYLIPPMNRRKSASSSGRSLVTVFLKSASLSAAG